MKKTILLSSAIVLIISNSIAQEKAFIKGKIIISPSASFGVYGTNVHSEWDYHDSFQDIHKTDEQNGGAASAVYALNLEYAINNWLGIGGRFGYSKYFTQADSTNNHIKPSVNGWDGGLTLGFHFVKTVHFDMPILLTCGYSHIKYQALNSTDGTAQGGGLNYGIALVPRIYFGNHIGMFFNVGYVGYNYPNLTLSDNTTNFNNINYTFKLKASGANVGLGLVFKFH